jgi:hypothetical protein
MTLHVSASAAACQCSLVYQWLAGGQLGPLAAFQSTKPSQTDYVKKGTTSLAAFAQRNCRRQRCTSREPAISHDNGSASREGTRRWSAVLSTILAGAGGGPWASSIYRTATSSGHLTARQTRSPSTGLIYVGARRRTPINAAISQGRSERNGAAGGSGACKTQKSVGRN